jgi:glucose dehydrogenase
VITGISGGEFGVRGRLLAYDLKTGNKVWTAWSTGPDSELLVDPAKTKTWTNGKMAPIGKGLVAQDLAGRPVEARRRHHLGLVRLRPEAESRLLRHGNPGTWNPAQRPGDNKWSMTLFARDLDTGMAKWAYQMTPHDEWDFDGVNENLLVDVDWKGQERCPRRCTSIATASATR